MTQFRVKKNLFSFFEKIPPAAARIASKMVYIGVRRGLNEINRFKVCEYVKIRRWFIKTIRRKRPSGLKTILKSPALLQSGDDWEIIIFQVPTDLLFAFKKWKRKNGNYIKL